MPHSHSSLALASPAADRWGGSSAVFAWELFNEVDLAGYDLPFGFYDWHEEMAGYLRKVDGGRHLITESFGLVAGNKFVDGSDSFDFTSTHNYARTSRGPQSPNVAKSNAGWSKDKTNWYKKPSIVGEFGYVRACVRSERRRAGGRLLPFCGGIRSRPSCAKKARASAAETSSLSVRKRAGVSCPSAAGTSRPRCRGGGGSPSRGRQGRTCAHVLGRSVHKCHHPRFRAHKLFCALH